jgi:hypothetical protein
MQDRHSKIQTSDLCEAGVPGTSAHPLMPHEALGWPLRYGPMHRAATQANGAAIDRVLAATLAAGLASGGLPAGEIPQAALETHHKVRADRWLPVGVTARRLGARLLRLADAEHFIKQLVAVR